MILPKRPLLTILGMVQSEKATYAKVGVGNTNVGHQIHNPQPQERPARHVHCIRIQSRNVPADNCSREERKVFDGILVGSFRALEALPGLVGNSLLDVLQIRLAAGIVVVVSAVAGGHDLSIAIGMWYDAEYKKGRDSEEGVVGRHFGWVV